MNTIEFSVKCSKCKGTGKIEIKVDPKVDEVKTEPCTACNGTGIIGEFTAKTSKAFKDELLIDQALNKLHGGADKRVEQEMDIADLLHDLELDTQEHSDRSVKERGEFIDGKIKESRLYANRWLAYLQMYTNKTGQANLAELTVMLSKIPDGMDLEENTSPVHAAIWTAYQKVVAPFR